MGIVPWAIWCCYIYAVLSHLSSVRLFCDPMDCSSPGSSIHGILQARIPEWVATFSSRGFLYIVLIYFIWSDQMRSVAQSCPTLCDPRNCSMPGLPVHHQLPEFTQTHVHPVSDAIQPSHPLSSPSTPAPNPPSIRVFSNESTLRMRWPKYWSFSLSISPSKEIPGLISFRMDWLDLLAVQGSLKSLLQHHS